MSPVLHITMAIIAAGLAGAAWAGIAGLLKALLGVNEVISTIRLNWIAIWGGVYLFGLGGPLQDPHQKSVPVSSTVVSSEKLPVFWGNAALQGLHIGLFIVLAAVVVFWVTELILLGFEIRATGAESGCRELRRDQRRPQCLHGHGHLRHIRRGGGGDGTSWAWKFNLFTMIPGVDGRISGYCRGAVGRNTAVGVVCLLFGALQTGRSTRFPGPSVF